jgi:hypothetical protein
MKLHGDAIGPIECVVELDEKYLGGKPRFVKSVRGKGTKKTASTSLSRVKEKLKLISCLERQPL